MITKGDTILFQGDSITDVGRSRDETGPNQMPGLGSGYASLIAARYLEERPEDDLKFINRGISGHRVVDLYARWKVDAINLKPDVISILVGVNDTWHEFGSQNGVEVDRYATIYRMMLEYTRQRLPDVRLILCEPFSLPVGQVNTEWLAELAERDQIVRDLADSFGACFVSFQAAFDEAAKKAPADHWLGDGVHPSPDGHALMADCWISTVQEYTG